MPSRDIKQVIVMRKDLKCRTGKYISQGSHASLAFLTRFSQIEGDTLSVKLKNPEEVQQWLKEGFTKICVFLTQRKKKRMITSAFNAIG